MKTKQKVTIVKVEKKKKKKSLKDTSFKILAEPLTDKQIKEFVAYHKEHGNFPGLKIPCSVTGKLTTCVGPWMDKKIKEFGSAENLLRNYKGRGAMKQEREDVKPIKIRRPRLGKKEKAVKPEVEYTVPKFVEYHPVPIGMDDVKEITKSQCMRPDLFLNNKRNCEGCYYYSNCQLHLKCLPKGVAFDGKDFVDSSDFKKKMKM